jgi:hypothetical protein
MCLAGGTNRTPVRFDFKGEPTTIANGAIEKRDFAPAIRTKMMCFREGRATRHAKRRKEQIERRPSDAGNRARWASGKSGTFVCCRHEV